jgi:hypothetical protein
MALLEAEILLRKNRNIQDSISLEDESGGGGAPVKG